MKKNRLWLPLFAAIAWLQMSSAVFVLAAQHEHATSTPEQVIKVGKKGDISISNETRAGDLVLKPGRYLIQHRVDGSDHSIHFVRPSGTEVGEVKCRLEPLEKKARFTKVYNMKEDGGYRITRVEVTGENVAHLF